MVSFSERLQSLGHYAPKPHHSTASDALTPEETELCRQLKANVASLVEQHAHLKAFCNPHTYVRYMRARKWDLLKATKMLMDTLHWRMEHKPHLIRWEGVEMEANSGKHYVYPARDKLGRPIVMMRPRLEDTKDNDSQIRFLIYDLEMASKIADESGVGKMCWILDFTGYGLKNATPLKVSMYCNHVLQNHYPERLGCAVCYHAPSLFTLTWKAVGPFIDPVTKAKIFFIEKGPKEAEQMLSRFHMDKMEDAIGGGHKGLLYNKSDYEKVARAFDAEVEALLAKTEAEMKAGTADHMSQVQKGLDGLKVGQAGDKAAAQVHSIVVDSRQPHEAGGGAGGADGEGDFQSCDEKDLVPVNL